MIYFKNTGEDSTIIYISNECMITVGLWYDLNDKSRMIWGLRIGFQFHTLSWASGHLTFLHVTNSNERKSHEWREFTWGTWSSMTGYQKWHLEREANPQNTVYRPITHSNQFPITLMTFHHFGRHVSNGKSCDRMSSNRKFKVVTAIQRQPPMCNQITHANH